MYLPQEAISEFQKMYFNLCGEKLSDEEACEVAEAFLDFYKFVTSEDEND